jgi:hypothetical protein
VCVRVSDTLRKARMRKNKEANIRRSLQEKVQVCGREGVNLCCDQKHSERQDGRGETTKTADAVHDKKGFKYEGSDVGCVGWVGVRFSGLVKCLSVLVCEVFALS